VSEKAIVLGTMAFSLTTTLADKNSINRNNLSKNEILFVILELR
jgi:hypothetical protein